MYHKLTSVLKREQKEAIGLLQVGTFLEYFDLMLYIHMAIVLNELFFPQTDPHTAALLSAFAFCSTYLLRPFGALLFGYIGDHIGRKATVVLTTFSMSISCIIMAILPTYAQIGISAAWIVTICRIAQGLSSMGEIVGAEIYLTEITRPPSRYPIVALTSCSSSLGAMMALVVATLVTSYDFNWRNAFWAGAVIAMIGSVARTRLRETPDFIDMKRRMIKAIADSRHDGLEKAAELLKSTNPIWREKTNWITLIAYFFMSCGWPVCFYFSYIHCGNILKNSFHFTSEQIIYQNFLVSAVQLLAFMFFVAISCFNFAHPLKILKIKFFIFLLFIFSLPIALQNVSDVNHIFLIQSISVIFSLHCVPANAIFMLHFPVFRRFTYASFAYASSRALTYAILSFGLVYLTEWFGHWGLWFIMIPATVCFGWSIYYFEKLESSTNDSSRHKSHVFSHAA